MTELSLHLTVVGVLLLGLAVVHVGLPRLLAWDHDLANMTPLNREVSYVHCYFVGLACLLWGLLPLTAGDALQEPDPVTRLVLLGAVGFWGSRLVIQVAVFNRHARDSATWRALSIAGTGLWAYLTLVWVWALTTQL